MCILFLYGYKYRKLTIGVDIYDKGKAALIKEKNGQS